MSRSCYLHLGVATLLLLSPLRLDGAPATQPAPMPAAALPPVISLSINGLAEGNTYAGWPILIEAVLVDSDPAKDTPKLQILDDAGKSAAWPVETLAAGPPDVTGVRSAYWIVPANRSATLAAGKYRFSASLTRGADEIAFSQRLTIAVAAEPAPLPPELLDDKFFLRARVAVVQKQDADAKAIAAEWLKALPDSLRAHTFQGDLHVQAKQFDEAHQSFQAALVIWRKQQAADDVEPPRELMARLNHSTRQLLAETRPAAAPAPPKP